MADESKCPRCPHCMQVDAAFSRLDSYRSALGVLKESGLEFGTDDLLLLANYIGGATLRVGDDD